MNKELQSGVQTWDVSIPVETCVSGTTRLNHTISAILLETGSNGERELKTVRQLQAGTRVSVCGSGYNAQTVKVQGDDGMFYFVFSEDLLISFLAEAAADDMEGRVPEAAGSAPVGSAPMRLGAVS